MPSLRVKDGIIRLKYWDKELKKNRERSLKLKDTPQGWKLAKAELKKYRAETVLGLNKRRTVKHSVTISGAKEYYVKYKTTGDRQVSQATIDQVNYASARMVECLGDIDLGTLNKEKFDEFVDWMKGKGLSVNSRHFVTSHLLPVFNLCKRDGLAKNFYFYVTHREEKAPRAIKKEDLDEILETLKRRNVDAYNFTYFLLLTGFRKSSALALTWDMVDMEARQIRVPNIKGKRSTDLFPIGEELYKLLESVPRAVESRKVLRYKDGRLHVWDWVQEGINERRKEKGEESMEHYTMHQLRKTFLSNMINKKGLKFEEVAYLAGHKDIRTTRKYYLEFDISQLRKKMDES